MTDQAVTADEQGEAQVTHPCGVCGTPLSAEQDAFHDCVADSEDERAAHEYSSLLALLVGTEADGENTLAMNQARALLASDWLLAREQAAAARGWDESHRRFCRDATLIAGQVIHWCGHENPYRAATEEGS